MLEAPIYYLYGVKLGTWNDRVRLAASSLESTLAGQFSLTDNNDQVGVTYSLIHDLYLGDLIVPNGLPGKGRMCCTPSRINEYFKVNGELDKIWARALLQRNNACIYMQALLTLQTAYSLVAEENSRVERDGDPIVTITDSDLTGKILDPSQPYAHEAEIVLVAGPDAFKDSRKADAKTALEKLTLPSPTGLYTYVNDFIYSYQLLRLN